MNAADRPAPGAPLRDPADLRRLYEAPRDGWRPFTLTDEQLAAATAPLAPGVIVAGAGSGKTTVMQARVVWLAGSGQVRPDQVLGLTFTNKAAGELAQRMRAAFAGAEDAAEHGEPTVSTYHSYAGRLLRDHGLRIGIEPGARLLADATRYQLAGRVLRRAEGPFAELTTTVGHLIGELVALDGELSEHLVDLARLRAEDDALIAEIAALPKPVRFARDAAQTARKRGELASLVAALRAEKRRLDSLDFGDQLAFSARLAQEYPSVGEAERDRYRVVLLDEYQDTSYAQKVLLRALFGGGHPVTAVGDPCQAIYGWRGASVANIDGFPEEFPDTAGAPARRYPLSVNNRSGGRLLDAANDLSAPLRAVHAGVVPLSPRPGREADGSIAVALHRTAEDELDWVVDQVAACLASGVPAREIAVLTRIRSRFGDYHAAFLGRGIPLEVVGLGGLLHLPEVADVVATLEVLDDPTANPALLRLLTGPRWRIGPRDLVLLGRRAHELVRPTAPGGPGLRAGGDAADLAALLDEAVAGVDPAEVVSLSDALANPGGGPFSAEARERFRQLADELAALRRHAGDPLADLLGRIAAVTGLEVEVDAAVAGGRGGRGEALAAFLSHAAGFTDLDGEAGLRAFLAYLRAAETYDRGLDSAGPSDADSVKLMTVHKAKGLEWDVVLLPDLTAKVFPSARSRAHWLGSAQALPATLRGDCDDFPPNPAVWNTAGAKEFAADLRALSDLEERRLGYVAVTRPRRMLFASSHWWGPTQKEPRGPSAYLETLREHAERVSGRVDRWEPKPDEGETNPALEAARVHPWPVALAEGPLAARREAAAWVAEALARRDAGSPEPSDEDVSDGDVSATATSRPPAGSRSPGGTATPGCCSTRPGDPTGSTLRCRCPSRSRRRPWSGWPRTQRAWPAPWSGRCPGRRPLRPRSAPASTRGSRSSSASRCCSIRSTSRARPTTRSPSTMPRCRPCRRPSAPGRTPAARRWRSRLRSRSCWAAMWSAGGSTRSTAVMTAATRSWTGRRAPRRPTRSSWPSTGWRGRGSPGCPRDRWEPPSSTSGRTGSSAPPTCRGRRSWHSCSPRVAGTRARARRRP